MAAWGVTLTTHLDVSWQYPHHGPEQQLFAWEKPGQEMHLDHWKDLLPVERAELHALLFLSGTSLRRAHVDNLPWPPVCWVKVIMNSLGKLHAQGVWARALLMPLAMASTTDDKKVRSCYGTCSCEREHEEQTLRDKRSTWAHWRCPNPVALPLDRQNWRAGWHPVFTVQSQLLVVAVDRLMENNILCMEILKTY